jgi:hypothetical protein
MCPMLGLEEQIHTLAALFRFLDRSPVNHRLFSKPFSQADQILARDNQAACSNIEQ